MSEHIRFITVGFADLLANLPDPDMVVECSECGHLHFDTTAGDYIACPLTDEGCPCPLGLDPDVMASDPGLADYWPDDDWTHDYVVSDDDDTDEWRAAGLDPNDAEPADRYPERSR